MISLWKCFCLECITWNIPNTVGGCLFKQLIIINIVIVNIIY